MSEAIVVNFQKYAQVPKVDPVTHHRIPEPAPKEVDRSKWEYVMIPETDIFDKPLQGVSLNGYKFERGKTYFVEPDVATEVRRILKTGEKADLRILQSHPDLKAINDQQRSGQQAGGSTFVRS
jgi:hypothetical protein